MFEFVLAQGLNPTLTNSARPVMLNGKVQMHQSLTPQTDLGTVTNANDNFFNNKPSVFVPIREPKNNNVVANNAIEKKHKKDKVAKNKRSKNTGARPVKSMKSKRHAKSMKSEKPAKSMKKAKAGKTSNSSMKPDNDQW